MITPNKLRRNVLDMIYNKKSGHIGGSFSLAEFIAYIYSNYDFINIDKLILSKGHAVPIVYSVLKEIGCLTDKDMDSFREIDSPLQGHPDKNTLKYIHATTGSLGQGLSIAIGHSIGMSLNKVKGKIFCILGDGEIQEGQVWEALMYYPKLKLTNMYCIIDWNKYQSDNNVNDSIPIYNNLEKIISNMGWDCETIDGHSIDDIEKSILKKSDKPRCIILNTIKGKGVSFMENKEWHSKVPNKDEYEKACIELGV